MAKRGKHKHKGKPQPAATAADANPVMGEAIEADDAVLEADAAAADEAQAVVAGVDSSDAAPAAAPVAAEPPAARVRRPAAERVRDARSPFVVLADYEQRSLAHVAGLPEQLDAPGLWRGVAYRVGSHRLASGFDEVIEILPMPALTPVPGSQAWMLGVANVRGTLLPVVDLKQFLEGERTVLHEGQRVLVMRQAGGDVALTIDELYGQRSFHESQQVEPGDLADGRYGHFIDRAFASDDQRWGVFALGLLARTPEFRQTAL